jgi:hypothetical protein
MTRSAIAFPYRIVPPDSVLPDTSGWSVLVEGRAPATLCDGEPFPEWDAKLVFVLERTVRIREELGPALGLAVRNGAFELVVYGATGAGLSRFVLSRTSLTDTVPDTVLLRISPDSASLAKDLVLTIALSLTSQVDSGDALSPTHPGNRLWESRDRFRLEGGNARLPLYERAFSAVYPTNGWQDAEVHVVLRDDPALELESAVAVFVNEERKAFVELLGKGDGPTELRVWGSVVRRILVSALLGDWMDDTGDYPPETLGGTVKRWLLQAFPGATLVEMRSRVRDDFTGVETRIDSWVTAVATASRGGTS